jgi:hypothetical protein
VSEEAMKDDQVWSILGNVLLAAFLGVVGQLVRVVAGLKKLNDQKPADNLANAAGVPVVNPPEQFSSTKLFTSLGISLAVGALAGVLSFILGDNSHSKSALLAVLGAGYSGTDFIEAFMRKVLPS